jgi:shikimate dehydrogenase
MFDGETAVYGVWGHPVRHSRSPRMQNAAFRAMGLNAVYAPFEVAPDSVGAAVAGVRALGIAGVNVTVPLKELIPPHLDSLDPVAERLGVVNTIVNRDGHLRGYSTDGPGFLEALAALAWPARGQSVYVIGAGGSARAVADSLASAGNRLQIANRTGERAQRLAAEISARFPGSADYAPWGEMLRPADLVVNTTSLGMHPREEEMPLLPPGLLEGRPRVYDLIYAPEETLLLSRARAHGCEASNGLGMLVYQGALSLSLWTNRPVTEIPVAAMERAVRGFPY